MLVRSSGSPPDARLSEEAAAGSFFFPDGTMRILVTNDDGIHSPGLTVRAGS
jgi:hypothetical protein